MFRRTAANAFIAYWGHGTQAMHRHYECTLQFEQFRVMQRFAVVDNLDAAWCSVQRGTVRSVAHEKCTAGEGRSSLVEHRAMIFTAAKPACAVLSLVKSVLSAFFLFPP